MLMLFVINTSSSSPAINKVCRLPATSVINMPWSVAAEYIAHGIHHTQWSQILTQNCDFYLLHLHPTPPLGGSRWNITMMSGIEKLEWFGYAIVKIFWRYVYLLWQNSWMWQMDGQTNRHTPHRLCLHSIMQQKSGCVARWAARERDKLTGKKTCKYYCIPSQYSNQFHAFYWKNWFVLEKKSAIPFCSA